MQRIIRKHGKTKTYTVLVLLAFFVPISLYFFWQSMTAQRQIQLLRSERATLFSTLTATQKAYVGLKNEDQYKVNQLLKSDLDKTHKGYTESITAYESMLDLRVKQQDTSKLDLLYASVVKELADLHYATAESQLEDLNGQIKKINDELAAAAAAEAAKQQAAAGGPAAPGPVSNNPPGSGYSFQQVKTDVGTFSVSIIAADLGSTKVVVDTASDHDCSNDCPVLSLGDYVSRSGAFAGVNGTYFCPASYPSCVGKTNSFDTLLMNKNKVYFNSANNVYSTVPVAVFGAGWARFIGRSLDWGRDTSVDAVIAMQPLLLSGGNIAYGDTSGPRGGRSFIGNKGSTVYIGVVFNASIGESAYTLKALGLENGLNLDDGGSVALWSGGYVAGPGRNIPNAVLFVRR